VVIISKSDRVDLDVFDVAPKLSAITVGVGPVVLGVDFC
jgi:hypothetical protein